MKTRKLDDNNMKELTPGIQRKDERAMSLRVTPERLLKDEELWFRAMHK